ncbi:MAG: L-lactate dehydrogenase [Chloroflexi bacterium]|nr:L-lactate dehydrogenase [Chloroflexota bacterium]
METANHGPWDGITRRGGRKVAIIGAGNVGATTAYALVLSGLCSEIVVVDIDAARAEGEAMDLAQSVPFGMPVRVRAGTYRDIGGAHVTVITAGANQRPGESRTDLLLRNWGVFKDVIPQVAEANPEGIIVIATNPVDVLTFGAWGLTNLPRGKVIGSGTILDTARFRSHLASHFRVDARSVHAYIIGEHGDTEVPVWSRASISGMTLHEFGAAQGREHDQAALDAIYERTRTAAAEIIGRKGATFYAVAAGILRLLEAILRDQETVLPVSCVLHGQYGLHGVALSLPAVIDNAGVREHLAVPLDPHEVELLHQSAATIRRSIERILE